MGMRGGSAGLGMICVFNGIVTQANPAYAPLQGVHIAFETLK